MKTIVAVFASLIAQSWAEKLSINTDLLSKVREVKEEPLTPFSRSTLRSQFVWRISVTRTTQTQEWTWVKADTSDPYRKLFTIMAETFKDPKSRDVVKEDAKNNYPAFMARLRAQGPEKFVESIVDQEFILYSDLLAKQRMWKDNWSSIMSFFDTIGEEGFAGMLENMDEVVNQSPGWTFNDHTPTYWTPGPGYFAQSSPQEQDEFVSEAMRRFTIPPPGCYTDPTVPTTQPQGIIYLASTLNGTHPTEEETTEPSEEDVYTTTERTIERMQMNPSLEAIFQHHFNRTGFNGSNQNADFKNRRDALAERFGAEHDDLLFYDQAEATSDTSTRKTLTHAYTHPTSVLPHLVTTVTKPCSTRTPVPTGETTYRPIQAEWVEYFNNLTHGTAVEYIYKLISTTPRRRRRRKLKPGQTEPPEDSTMYVSPEYIVDENETDTYTFEELTLPTEKKVWKLKYTLPSTTSKPTSQKTRRTRLAASVKYRRRHGNASSTILAKLQQTLGFLGTTSRIP